MMRSLGYVRKYCNGYCQPLEKPSLVQINDMFQHMVLVGTGLNMQ